MANFYKYAIIRFAPDDVRGESINLGILIFTDSGVDIRTARHFEKVRAISSAIDQHSLRQVIENLRGLDTLMIDSQECTIEERATALSRSGPIVLSRLGTFVADGVESYEFRVSSIIKALVEPEPAKIMIKEKRSKLLSQIKLYFKQQRVLAKKDESLSSHRIISRFQLESGLVADLVLKNGAMHVVETVDASGQADSLKKAISDIGVSALVLETARIKFGTAETKARLVYSASSALESIARPSLEAAQHQGTELINWSSADDQRRFVHALSSLATPYERRRKADSNSRNPQWGLFS